MPEVSTTKKVMVGTKDAKLEFEVPQPYAEGHVLTAIEAKQLNQIFAENICNNMRSKVQAHLAGEAEALNETDLRAAFAKYANEYVFTEASAGGSAATMTPEEKEAKRIATAYVIKHLADTKRKRKDVPKENFDAEVARVAQLPDVIKLAKKRVKEQEGLQLPALEDGAGPEDAAAA